LPVPTMAFGSIPPSSAILRAAGDRMASSLAAAAAAGAAAAGAAAAAAGAAATAAPAAPRRPSSSPESTVSPSFLTISASTPSASARTSITTLSVSMSTISSSRLTASPGFLCQVATVPSATDSGKVGALISIAILCISYGFGFFRHATAGPGVRQRSVKALNGESILQQLFLLLGVHRRVATGRRSGSLATGVGQAEGLLVCGDDAAHVMLAAVPGTLVHRLFLAPDHVLEVLVRRHDLGQLLFRERIELLDADDGGVLATLGATLLQQVV